MIISGDKVKELLDFDISGPALKNMYLHRGPTSVCCLYNEAGIIYRLSGPIFLQGIGWAVIWKSTHTIGRLLLDCSHGTMQ